MLLQAISAAPDATNSIISGLLQFGAFGALVGWIVLRVIPSMQADSAAARADTVAARLAFTQALTELRTTYVEEMRLERESHAHEMDRLLDQILKKTA